MQCGLYGKLPAKRDFIAVGAPREFLNVWEPWLQGAVSASRTQLGEAWQQAFLTAPIWRFWLGADICGSSMIGAFMSSLDGVGRYFPLTLFARADDNAAIPPPELGAQDDWFGLAEDFLMSILDQNADYEAIMAGLGELGRPYQEFCRPSVPDIMVESDGTIVMPAGAGGFSDLFRSMRQVDHARIYAASTFWWTIGGEGFAPVGLCGKRMPDPFLFAAMLTGDFAQHAA
jgi:type VI secretion system protein ImpM